ncbi:ABC transporter ATP-binding protein [Actinokineospora diospyrosa]|uniref:ABC transport system ATP-binding protein n=1 Tax=Actinokineospora diospyrosa TaxID=103728 RepID=A0ABT1I982_9PSEU|nr:ATP-binding cassette domain-containing protein [Actinokineospora diospyrosa]MCP2269172.1 putative ABC transport system ATP-binding protein [Actinokineospora diospyrosa]
MTLVLDSVTLTYPDGDRRLTALDDVSLHVPAGTVTAVVGPSGSGKSSLLAVAATLITPDTGTITIGGTSTTGLNRAVLARLRRRHVGIVFQQANLLPALTAAEQLRVVARLDGRRGGADLQAEAGLAEVGLAELAHRRPHQLSGGQRQRVNIARALVNRPAVLLVDEPTSALDRASGAAIIDLLTARTREHGVATVLVTHDRAHLDGVDQVVELVDGQIAVRVSRAE